MAFTALRNWLNSCARTSRADSAQHMLEPKPFAIVLNDELEWSRGKRAAHAAHAALALHGAKYTHAVRVLNAKPRDLDMCDLRLPVEGVRCGMSRDYDADAVTVHVVVKKSDTRDTTALTVAQMMVYKYLGFIPDSVTLVSGTESDVLSQRSVVRDHGRTELPRGTVTAGASWT